MNIKNDLASENTNLVRYLSGGRSMTIQRGKTGGHRDQEGTEGGRIGDNTERKDRDHRDQEGTEEEKDG